MSADRARLAALLDGYRNTAMIHAAARLGIAEALGGRTATAPQMADEMGLHEQSLERLLRGLATIGIVDETASGFRLTELGGFLARGREDSIHPAAILCGEEYMAAWNGLAEGVASGRTPFDAIFGMTPWEHRASNPAINEAFNRWLAQATTQSAQGIAAAYDFSSVGSVCDVGGGDGALLATILRLNPGTRGILFDQPHVHRPAPFGLENRWSFHGGDFFAGIGAQAAVYTMKSVIHDWNDEQSLLILRNLRRDMAAGSRLLLIERLLPARAVDDPLATMIDLHMMVVTGGRERAESEYRRLLEHARFAVDRVIPTAPGFHLFEAHPG